MTDIVIVAAARTAVGKFGGSLAKTAAPELGATVIRSLLQRTGLAQLGHQPNAVDLAVSRLRRKLPQWGLQAQGIQTLRGQGYVWAQAGGVAEAGPW